MRWRVVPVVAAFLVSGCATGPWSRDDCGAPCAPPVPAVTTPAPPEVPVTAPEEQTCLDGVRVELGLREAAMGLRVQGIALVNCGAEPYTVEGYPRLETAGGDGVTVLDGVGEITSSLGAYSAPPAPVTLQPGERAGAALVWRSTYDDTRRPPVLLTSVRVTPRDGGTPRELTPEGGLDLGSTGRLGVSPWVRS